MDYSSSFFVVVVSLDAPGRVRPMAGNSPGAGEVCGGASSRVIHVFRTKVENLPYFCYAEYKGQSGGPHAHSNLIAETPSLTLILFPFLFQSCFTLTHKSVFNQRCIFSIPPIKLVKIVESMHRNIKAN